MSHIVRDWVSYHAARTPEAKAVSDLEKGTSFTWRELERRVGALAHTLRVDMNLRPGDLVPANQPVAKMLEPSQLWVRVYVPEPQLGRVRIGQKAALTVDTFPKRSFPGHVVEIRTQAEYTPRNVQTLDQRMDQVFGVKVAIDPAPELKPGMAATARLEE